MKKITLVFSSAILLLTSTIISAQCPPSASNANPGVFHIPTVANPVKRYTWQPPAGTYYKIHMSVDVKFGQWDANAPQNMHEIFWLVRDAKNFDMFGYVAVNGPGTNQLMLRHGWQVDHGHKAKLTEKTKLFDYTFTAGTTYTFDYTYDAAGGFIQLLVINKSNGQQRMRLNSYPYSDSFSFTANEDVTIDFGFDPALNPNEVATYGWEYSNIKIDLFDDVPPAVSASSVVKATCTACPDGQAQVTVTGGTPPYNYAWSNSTKTTSSVVGMLPGGYTVTATDSKGCVDKKNISIGLLPNPNVVQPVKISDADPHWVEYKGDVTYLAGFTHGLGSLSNQDQYYKAYIDWLAANNLNCLRNTPFMGQEYDDNQLGIMSSPFKRTGPGLANDGKLKYDLTQYDPAFFTYWKNVLSYAQSKNVIMFLTLLDGWHLRQWDKNQCNGNSTGSTGEWCHTYDTYYGANNINGVNAANITQYHDPSHPVNQWQKQFIQKMVDELGSFPNIIWEVCNENFQNRDWESKLGDFLTNYELSKGMTPHLVLAKDIPNHEQTPGGRQTIPVDELHRDLSGMHDNPVPHLFHNDGPNQGSSALMRQLTWQALTAGANANIFSVTSWTVPDSIEMASQDYQDRLKYVGFSRKFLNDYHVDLRGMKPDTTLASNNYLNVWALGRMNSEYILYYKAGGNSTINGMPANYNAWWFNPRTGTSQTAIPANGNTFTAPDNNDWVLYIHKPKKTDALPYQITSPLAYNCKDTTDLSVLIQNNGTLDMFNVKLNYKLDNNAVVTSTQALSPWVKHAEKRWILLPNELKNLSQGNHTLKIWTSNPNDVVDSNTANDTLTYSFNVTSSGKPMLFSEGFENGMPADWTTFNPDGKENWWVYTGAGYTSTKSAVVNNFAYTGAYFEPDYLALPEVDLTSAQNPFITFMYSHASKPVAYRYDSLSVMISTDCGNTFTSIWSKGGSALNTASASATIFIPAAASEWMQEEIDLNAYKTSTNAILVFTSWSNNNNSILIDNINILDSLSTTSAEDASTLFSVTVYPNPATESVQINFNVQQIEDVKLKLVNALGQVVKENELGIQQAGNHSVKMDVRNYPAGIYNLMLESGDKMVSVQKMVLVR